MLDLMKRFDPYWMVLLVVGALNVGVAMVFGTDVLDKLFSGAVLDVVHGLIGIAGVRYLPEMFDHLGIKK